MNQPMVLGHTVRPNGVYLNVEKDGEEIGYRHRGTGRPWAHDIRDYQVVWQITAFFEWAHALGVQDAAEAAARHAPTGAREDR